MTDPLELLDEIQKEEAEIALSDPKVRERLMVSTLITLRDSSSKLETRVKRLERVAVLFTGIIIAIGSTFPWLLDLLRKRP